MLRIIATGCVVALACATAAAPSAKKSPKFTKKQMAQGAEIYARNCSPCHGAHLDDPNGAFDLRIFPPTSMTASSIRSPTARTACLRGAASSSPKK